MIIQPFGRTVFCSNILQIENYPDSTLQRDSNADRQKRPSGHHHNQCDQMLEQKSSPIFSKTAQK